MLKRKIYDARGGELDEKDILEGILKGLPKGLLKGLLKGLPKALLMSIPVLKDLLMVENPRLAFSINEGRRTLRTSWDG